MYLSYVYNLISHIYLEKITCMTNCLLCMLLLNIKLLKSYHKSIISTIILLLYIIDYSNKNKSNRNKNMSAIKKVNPNDHKMLSKISFNDLRRH